MGETGRACAGCVRAPLVLSVRLSLQEGDRSTPHVFKLALFYYTTTGFGANLQESIVFLTKHAAGAITVATHLEPETRYRVKALRGSGKCLSCLTCGTSSYP